MESQTLPVLLSEADVEEASRYVFADSNPVKPARIYRDEPLSDHYDADIWIADETDQTTGAYKVRGAVNWFAQNVNGSMIDEVIACSAGNHGAAVAKCAYEYGIPATIFMPVGSPKFKVNLVKRLGGSAVTIRLEGDSVDQTVGASRAYLEASEQRGSSPAFVHPFNDPLVAAGQGTLGLEILGRVSDPDLIVAPVGGGGLLTGLIAATSSLTGLHYVAVEPSGARSLGSGINGETLSHEEVDSFVDGAAVGCVGSLVLETVKAVKPRLSLVGVDNETLVKTVIKMWEDPLSPSPELAGALSVASLQQIRDEIRGKTIVCIVSGGNLCPERYAKDIRGQIKNSKGIVS
jgi:threonine dehydratase